MEENIGDNNNEGLLAELGELLEEQALTTVPERVEALKELISIEKKPDNSTIMLDNISK